MSMNNLRTTDASDSPTSRVIDAIIAKRRAEAAVAATREAEWLTDATPARRIIEANRGRAWRWDTHEPAATAAAKNTLRGLLAQHAGTETAEALRAHFNEARTETVLALEVSAAIKALKDLP